MAGAVLAALVAQAAAQTPASRPPPPWVGMWSGRSISSQKLLDDPVRKLSRSSDGDFWFVIDANGQVKGEGFVTYSADLKAMKWKVPIPGAGGTIDAEVGGSSGKIIKRIGIAGTLKDTPARPPDRRGPGGTRASTHGENHEVCELELSLQAMGTNEEGQPAAEVEGTIPGITFDFKIEAQVNVPAGVGGGAATAARGLPGGGLGMQVISVPANGWSPFQSFTPKVERGPGEPMRVMVEDKGEKHYILWYAVQQGVR
ncbi:MAG: hypothetical protein HY656_04625 [Acidobacteria bacterium]|nr:hypothetical protein [Acidobacteriota bacterium]